MFKRIAARKGITYHHYPLNISNDGYKSKWLDIAGVYLSNAVRPLIKRYLYLKNYNDFTLIEQILVGEEEIVTLTLHRIPKHVLQFIIIFLKPVW